MQIFTHREGYKNPVKCVWAIKCVRAIGTVDKIESSLTGRYEFYGPYGPSLASVQDPKPSSLKSLLNGSRLKIIKS